MWLTLTRRIGIILPHVRSRKFSFSFSLVKRAFERWPLTCAPPFNRIVSRRNIRDCNVSAIADASSSSLDRYGVSTILMHHRLLGYPARLPRIWDISVIRSFFSLLSVPPLVFPVHYERDNVRRNRGVLSSMLFQPASLRRRRVLTHLKRYRIQSKKLIDLIHSSSIRVSAMPSLPLLPSLSPARHRYFLFFLFLGPLFGPDFPPVAARSWTVNFSRKWLSGDVREKRNKETAQTTIVSALKSSEGKFARHWSPLPPLSLSLSLSYNKSTLTIRRASKGAPREKGLQ